MIDISVSSNCKNPESYGEICVRCNKCGRFGMTKDEAFLRINDLLDDDKVHIWCREREEEE